MVEKNELKIPNRDEQYMNLINKISEITEHSRAQVAKAINVELIQTYWLIGQYIVEFEQDGQANAIYGSKLLTHLQKDLTHLLGKGFSRSNLQSMRLLYLRFPNCQTVSGNLSWSHYLEILGIDDELERNFYIKEVENNYWSVRELRRQKNSGLFYRLALAKDKEEVLTLAKVGNDIQKPNDIIKSSYVLEFLNLPERNYSESQLEDELVKHLEEFLLELGRGFAFIGRQYRMTIDNDDYFADLVFYHVVLKCYVVIDLKLGQVKHQDVGQMNMYLGYFALDKNNKDDNPPIGIILGADKNDTAIKYATYGMDSNLFVSKYQLYLPDVEELKRALQEQLQISQAKIERLERGVKSKSNNER